MSRSIESYKREQAILNSVLEAPTGCVAKFASAKEARTFRINCYAFRKLDRESQAELYEVGDPKRGTSPYDMIRFELEADTIKMTNCETLLQVHGVESLVDLDTGREVEVELKTASLPSDTEVSLEKEFADAIANAEEEANRES